MNKLIITVVVIASYVFTPSTTLPQGAPESVCDTMLPFHSGGIPPMSSTPPFRIVSEQSALNQGQMLRVRIDSLASEMKFGGFMIHARNINPPYQVLGRFAISADGLVKLINCGGIENTATHSDTTSKQDLSLQWQAPQDFIGDVVFRATVAQTYSNFWVGLNSDPVRVVARNAPLPPSNGISTTRRPILTTIPLYEPDNVQSSAKTDAIYEGCGQSKTCFGFPDKCVNTQSCQTVATVNVRGEIYEFEIKSGYQNPAYVAVALSTDSSMGDDSVMECIPENGNIRAYTSWTAPGPNYGVTRDGVPQNIIRLVEGSYTNGVIYCKIQRDARSTVLGRDFDLINNKYHLLVASGSSLKANSVGYHDIGKIASASPSNLAEVSVIGGRSKVLIRLHAAFMLVAWIGTASIGIVLARYFKQTWVGSQLCGKDQWFAWHRICMVATWTLTIAAAVLIFIEVGGWSGERNPHAILGTITTIICFLQPIGALFRPAPNSKNRPIFNWLHWLGGNVAHICAVVTIFFAVKLAKAELPAWFDWILVAFVAFHVVVHLVLSIAGCASDRGQRVNSFPMADMSPARGSLKDRKLDAPYSGLRKVILTIYLVIVILFVVALVVIAVLAPIEDMFKSMSDQ